MDKTKKQLLEAFIRDGILEDKATPINEVQDYGWEYPSLADAIEDTSYQEYLDESLSGDQVREYEIGDIIFANQFYSPSSKKVVGAPGHRVLVITSKKDDNGIMNYRGFELSSKVNKSNINSHYVNNLYIKDYSTILAKGTGPSIEAIIRVDDLVKLNSKDLSPTGTYKGQVSNEFLQFVQKAYNNYRSGRSKDNAKMQWEVE